MPTISDTQICVLAIDVSVHRDLIARYLERQALYNSYRRRYVQPEVKWYEAVRLRQYEPDPSVYRTEIARLTRQVAGRVGAYFNRSHPDVVGYLNYIQSLHHKFLELEHSLEQKKREADRFWKSELKRLDFTINVVEHFGRAAAHIKFRATVTVGVLAVVVGTVPGIIVGSAYAIGKDLVNWVTNPADADVFVFSDSAVDIGWTAKNEAVSRAITHGAVRGEYVAKGAESARFSRFLGGALGTPQAVVGAVFAFVDLQDDLDKFK